MRERENKVLRERKGTIHAPGGGTTYLTIIKTETNEEKNSTKVGGIARHRRIVV